MEPFTIFLLMLVALTSSGVARRQYKRVKKKRRERMRVALLEKFAVPGRYLSIYDLFWDLGVNDFALEIMASQSLLPSSPEEAVGVSQRIKSRVGEHGSYEAFVSDVLEAIEEFYREHQRAGHRRQLPTLTINDKKLLPAPEGMKQASTALVKVSDGLPDGYLLDVELQQRTHMREQRNFGSMGLVVDVSGGQVDIDQLVKVSPGMLLKSLFDGQLKQQAMRWFEMSQLRVHRRELDRALAALFSFFDERARQDPAFLQPLYDLFHRWAAEADRIERLEAQRPWGNKPWALAADVLLEEARIMAHFLERHARKNADDAVNMVRQHAIKGDHAMAGYLIYLNHYAFFASISEDYSALIRDIEFATGKIQRELGVLRAKQLL